MAPVTPFSFPYMKSLEIISAESKRNMCCLALFNQKVYFVRNMKYAFSSNIYEVNSTFRGVFRAVEHIEDVRC